MSEAELLLHELLAEVLRYRLERPMATYNVLTLDNALLCTVKPARGYQGLLVALKNVSEAFESASTVVLLTDGRRLVMNESGAPLCYLVKHQSH